MSSEQNDSLEEKDRWHCSVCIIIQGKLVTSEYSKWYGSFSYILISPQSWTVIENLFMETWKELEIRHAPKNRVQLDSLQIGGMYCFFNYIWFFPCRLARLSTNLQCCQPLVCVASLVNSVHIAR